ncbi:flavin-containing monooxygenase [Rhodococcus triatomae]
MAQPSITIVGAGFGGLAQAIALRRAGFRDVTILERADDVGGVWRANTYPGAACDVPSPLYSLSTDPNPDWPRRYAEQLDILDYLRGVADSHDIRTRIRFGVEVREAVFDEQVNRWTLTTADGERIDTDVLVSAVGQLSQPSVPDIDGRDTFRGAVFHSAEWNHDVDLAGKRVAVIGTGASAIQFIPAIAPETGHLTVFQRSAAWVVSKPDSVFGERRRRMFRAVPATLGAERLGTWVYFEGITLALRMRMMGAFTRMLSRRHLRRQVADPVLRAALTPDYEPWCKRLLFSDDYYPALAREDVSLVVDRIDRLEPDGVRTVDGTLHPADVVVFGTGFAATDFLAPMEVRGRAGRSLGEAWVKGARAYLGISTAGFPNLFMMYGPNTNLGSGSIVYMLESQARHICGLVTWLAENPGHAVEVDPAVEDRFNVLIQQELDRSVWSRCSSWYRNSSGTVTTNWPGNVSTYRRRTRRVDRSDYRLSAPSGPR